MTRPGVLLLAVLALLVVPLAAAHGVSGTRVEKVAGPYRVVFRTSPHVLAGFSSHASWEVTNRSSNTAFEENATATFRYADADNGTLVEEESVAEPTSFENGTRLVAAYDVPVDARRMQATLTLPEATVTVELDVHATQADGDPPPTTPLGPALALAAIVIAVKVRARS